MPEASKMAVGELARRTGVSTAAINFYVREGVLPAPEKTSRTRALYDHSYVQMIERIKDLQARGLPLRVISTVLREADPAAALGVVEPPRQAADAQNVMLDIAGFGDETGLSLEDIRSALDLGLLVPSSGGRVERSLRFDSRDVGAGRALARLLASGIGFDLLARHTAEFEPLTRAESHFLAEHLTVALGSEDPRRAVRETSSGFSRLRNYLRIKKFEAEYPDLLQQR